MTSTSQKKDDKDKGIAYFWKSTSIEPQISSLSLSRGVSKVALGNEHTLILTYNSEVFAVGENYYGQLGFGDLTRRVQTTRVTKLGEKHVVDVGCGAYHSAAVCDDGNLFCWGDSSNGQCGIGDIKSTNVPTLVVFNPALSPTRRPRSRLVDSEDANIITGKYSSSSDSHDLYVTKIKEVACGDGHTLALTSAGRVWSWGVGCLTGHGFQNECVREPREVEGLKGRYVTGIRCGAYHSIALVKDTSIHAKLIPHRNEKLIQGASGKKQSKRLRRFSRSKESTKGLKKTQALLENTELSPKGLATDIRRIHVNTSPKTYLGYDPVSSELQASSHTKVTDSDDRQDSGLRATHDLPDVECSTGDKRDSCIKQLNYEQTEVCTVADKNQSPNGDGQDFPVDIETEDAKKIPEYHKTVDGIEELSEDPTTVIAAVLSEVTVTCEATTPSDDIMPVDAAALADSTISSGDTAVLSDDTTTVHATATSGDTTPSDNTTTVNATATSGDTTPSDNTTTVEATATSGDTTPSGNTTTVEAIATRGDTTPSENTTTVEATATRGHTMPSDNTATVDPAASTDSNTSNDKLTSSKPQTASASIPINRLSIHDNHYGFPEIRQSRHDYMYLEGSSPEPSPPQPGFLEHQYFNHVTSDLFVTTDVSGSLCETSALFESVEPGSLTSVQSGGTDSDPEEVNVSPTVEEKGSPAASSYLHVGFGMLASRFRHEMDLGKFTSAVYDSVTGMFMSSTSTIIPSQSDKSLTQGESCSKCGILGICICNEVAGNGKKLSHKGYDTEVWTWGRGGCGQLGHGDTDDRLIPYCVEGLRGMGVIKIAAGTFHSLALTIYCQVFSWGDNSCGQLGHKKAMAVKPRKVKCFSDVLIWDIACGSHYSLFIGDLALNRPDVYVCGRQPSEMPVIAAALNKMQGKSSFPLSKDDTAVKTPNKSKPPLTHSRSFDDVKERSFGAVRVELVRLIMFRKVGSIRCVLAQNEHCCCIADSDTTGVLEMLGELSSEERLFYYQLALIWQSVLVPVIQSELWSLMVPQESGSVLVPVVQAYLQLMKCVSSSMVSVTNATQAVESMDALFDSCLSEEFITAFERYSEVFCNAVAYGVFMLFTSLANDVGPQCKAVLRDLLEDADKEFIGYMEAFQWVARVPLIRMQHYVVLTNKLLTLLPQDDSRYGNLQHVSEVWKTLTWQDEKRYLVAEQTRQFWEECSSKIMETFKVPNRRLLRSSKTHPLYPSKSTRFSSPMYVLFDDYFVYIQSNKNYQALPLNTLWAVSVDNSDSLINAIKIVSPEETLLVCAPCTDDKADWLLTINQAVARVISKTTAHRLGKNAVNLTTGNLSAATAREAAYTYIQDARYKAATYSGMWLTGKPHGRGEIVWPDGRCYTGEFNQGLHDGDGVMVFPVNVPENPAERYEGQWMGGKMTGFGRMRYTNGDTYIGYWMDNMRHGHGTMKCGALSSSAASVYIGEWLYNKRHGYGTLDDVLKGEKYMGLWENDYRHGAGIFVTLEGIYTQGNFVQNKLMGAAQLVCDDNTFFDGEFAGHCQLAGKGTLTLPNGDMIDGTFAGQWGDGIKINGTYLKRESDSNSKSKSVTPEVKPVVSPDRKWTALFRQCREALGCLGDRDADPQTVWKCISMTLLNGHNGKLPRIEQDIMQELLNVNNEMERTGNHSLDDKALQNYLAKAFEINYHPLGQLVTNLVDVYRATYVGMGTHRRLLPHAVLEAKSIVHRLYSIVRLLFIELPNEEYVHLDKDSLGGVSNIHTEMSTSSSGLLHPIVLPLLYPPLFTLYALHNERADSVYWERLLHLNWRSDLALMTYVGVKRQFWLASEGETKDYNEEIMGEHRESHHYATAIEALQQISTKLSPMEKLAVLKTTFEKINEEVHTFWKGEEKLISLDDLFPVFQFVTIRARIPHLGSEIHFIDDMVDSHVHVGEQGHMFTTLQACFFQIQNEKG